MNRRESAGMETASKYMVDVKDFKYLSNLIEYLNTDLSKLPQWEQEFIAKLKNDLQQELKTHFETTAATRQKFVSMPPEQWKDHNGLFRLTERPRPVIGYLPKKEIETLDNMCHKQFLTDIETHRGVIESALDNMRASEADHDEVKGLLESDAFFLQDVEAHRKAAETWKSLSEKKVAILKQLEEREVFLDEVEEFERTTSGDPTRYSKSSVKLAEENKFRANAAKKMQELDSKAIQACRQYETETGREFQVDGIKYLEMIKEQKFGRGSNPALSLAKLRPQAIPTAARSKYAGGVESNLVQADAMTKKLSLHEQGKNPNQLIRSGKK